MSNKKTLNPSALSAIMKSSEVKEQNVVEEVAKEVEVVKRKRVRKEFRNFSVSLELDDYNKFQEYLNKNDIASGSAFIRELLREKGVI